MSMLRRLLQSTGIPARLKAACSREARRLPETPQLASRPVAATALPALYRLSPSVEQMRAEAIDLLRPSPRWTSRAAERLALRERIQSELDRLQSAPAGRSLSQSTSAHDRWFMSDLLTALRAFDNYFLLSYDVDAGECLSEALLPVQRRVLETAVMDMFRTTAECDWPRLVAMLDPLLLRAAPGPLPTAPPVKDQLLQDELFALVDYLHPHTHHFIVINGGMRLSRYWQVHGLADAAHPLRTPYLSALDKLQRSGLFTDRTGTYAKGIVARGDAGQLSTTLEFLADRGGCVMPPHPVSATRWHQQSFARQSARLEDTTLILHAPEAIDVGPFHGARGKMLGEVILLPRPWQVLANHVDGKTDSAGHFHLHSAADSPTLGSRRRFERD